MNHATITNAIRTKQTILVLYKGLPRIVEPHIFGKSATGAEFVRCYQTGGLSCSKDLGWRLFDIDKIQAITAIHEFHFSTPRADYIANDPVIKTVYAKL